MLKDQVEKQRVRGPSGRWTPRKALERMKTLQQVLATNEPALVQVFGLTALSTEYNGLCGARRRLEEQGRELDHVNPPTIQIEVFDQEMQKVPSTVWQLDYRSEAARHAQAQKAFFVKVSPGERLLSGRLFRLGPDGKPVPMAETTQLEAAGREGFDEQWNSYDENLASYKRQLLKRFRREDKEEIYVAMRADPATYEPYWKDLAAAGLDYKETLEQYYAKQRAGSARLVAEREVQVLPPKSLRPGDAPVAVKGVMTLQELRRILEGFGELPAEGAEDTDEGWLAFETRFCAANGQEAKGPLRAALRIVRRSQAATSQT